jgi:surfeit locus 1 family protein
MLLWTFPATTFGLGVWQIYRYKQKLALIQEAWDNLRQEPLSHISSQPYRRLRLQGTLDEQHVKVNGVEHGIRGYYYIHPFILASGETILVQTGFAPEQDTISTVSQEGIVLKPERHGYRPSNSEKEWFWKDAEALANKFNAQPVLVAMTKTDEHKHGIVPVPQYRNNHMQYIITWFGISTATTWMCWKRGKVNKRFY